MHSCTLVHFNVYISYNIKCKLMLLKYINVFSLQTRLMKVGHYVSLCKDGFLEPSIGTSYIVYIIFCFGNVPTQSTHSYFGDYFTWRTAMDAVYSAKDITKTTTQWKSIGRSTIKLAVLSTLFELHLKENDSCQCERQSSLHPSWTSKL